MSRVIGGGCGPAARALLVGGLLACASTLQACGKDASPETPAVTTRTGAVVGVVCPADPNIPCVSTDNGRVLSNLKIINMFMSSDWDSDNAGTPFTKQAINDFTTRFVAEAQQYFSFAQTDYQGAGTSVSFGGSFD